MACHPLSASASEAAKAIQGLKMRRSDCFCGGAIARGTALLADVRRAEWASLLFARTRHALPTIISAGFGRLPQRTAERPMRNFSDR